MPFDFQIVARDSETAARTGLLRTAHGETVHDRDACLPRRVHEPDDVGDRTALRFRGQLTEHGRVADDRVLTLLGHQRGMHGIDQCNEIERHRSPPVSDGPSD